ncbi:hypothetical protein [Guptibacillus hwajinpoensis]|uniref:hypothetical protein n=1 Tax=Guptibacillus hwajinpoensis TaxID=208199 RepID=UPI0037361D55
MKEVFYKEPDLPNWSGRMLDSCGTSRTGETPQAQCFCAPRRLSARPAESEHPEAEINHYSYNNKVYEKSFKKVVFEKDFVSKILISMLIVVEEAHRPSARKYPLHMYVLRG